MDSSNLLSGALKGKRVRENDFFMFHCVTAVLKFKICGTDSTQFFVFLPCPVEKHGNKI